MRFSKNPSDLRLSRAAGAVAALLLAASTVAAEDVSAPAILQWFEGTYRTQELRAADVFNAGYGGVWVPPPGRADSGNQSVGYDVYDRFDLGKPGNPTLYGTETGLKTVARTFDRAGVDLHVDLIINHNGFSDQGDDGFIRSGGYPGFVLQNPDGGSDPYGIPNTDGDFNSAYDYGDIRGRLSGLIDINHSTNWRFIRHPVTPGDPRNIPAGTDPHWGRLANQVDPNNARFYPDRDGPYIDVYDPATGESGIRIYSFNTEDPMAGDAIEENATGLLMRYAQWMVQEIGADHFRIDAAKHVEGFTFTYLDRAVYRANPRKLLDGSQAHVFLYGEVFDSNRDFLLYGPDHSVGNPDWRDNFVRKDINPADPGRVGGNRDVLDFATYDALRHNLSSNGFQNDFRNLVNAGLDVYDDGLRNGSAGVLFVGSHDEGPGAHLNNVAHAYTLMQPGNAVVYFNGKEHGDGRDFPKAGRGDALGGMYGNAITTLVNIRNTHGRGNYRERWLEKENYAFEREGSAVVLLSNRLDGGFDTRRMDVGFAWGTTLVELTGNAAADGNIPELVTVDNDYYEGPSKATFRFRRNDGGDQGYLIYGLATPRSEQGLQLSNVSQVITGGDPTTGPGSADYRNGTTRLADVHVITGDSFGVTLQTQAVTLAGTRLEGDQLVYRTIRDRDADGDNALIRIDGGIDVNGNGHVDYVTPGTVAYGFEEFATVRQPGYFAADGNGRYEQIVDASQLSEGYHFIEVRAFRHRADGGPAVYSPFKQTIYVDRLKPVSGYDSNKPVTIGETTYNQNRDFFFRSLDATADNMHVFLDLGAALTDEQVLAMVGGGSQTDYWDRDLFKKYFADLAAGNHAFTVVTYEITGNWNVQRFAGIGIDSPIGAGLGDATFDKQLEGNDLDIIYNAIVGGNQFFNPAGDFDADGWITLTDWQLLGQKLLDIHQSGATKPDGFPLVSQGTLDYYNFLSGSVPEPANLTLLAAASTLLRRRRNGTRTKK